MTRTALLRTSAALALVALLGACGGSKSDSTSDTTATTAGGAVTTAAAGGGAAASSTAAVDIKNTAFSPKDVTVAPSGTVTWTFSDAVDHQVVADDGSFKSSDKKHSGTFEVTFDKAGTVAYHCGIHAFMKGTVTVT
jgi:plastocyanin